MRRLGWPVAVAAIVFYAALLRFDAMVEKYGLVAGPPWMESAEQFVASVAHGASPSAFVWQPVGERHGDPRSYLKIARARQTFYQAGAREPLFLATIQVFLRLTGDQDIAVNLASTTYSVLLVLATCLLGAAAFMPAVGLGAGALLALEATTIGQGADGWRDDAFAFFTVAAAWALVRLRSRGTIAYACAAATFAAGACLVRLSALSFVVPGLLVAALDGGENRRARLPYLAAAAVLCAALVAPFMIGNAIVFGDPFYSVDFATEFYRGRAEAPVEHPLAVGGVLAAKLLSRPLETLDTLVPGFLTYPFRNKWQGLDYLSPGLAAALSASAVVGLVLFARTAEGRLLLVVLFGALVPFAAIWRTKTGAQWRFTLFAYPFYLIAAAAAVRAAVSLRIADVRRRAVATLRKRWAAAALALGLAMALVAFSSWWQYLVVREVAAAEGAYTIAAGPRDANFFGEGWYAPATAGVVVGRYSHGPVATMFLPIFERTDTVLSFRMQACSADERASRAVQVSINGRPSSTLSVVWNPERAGSYDVLVSRELLRQGWNRVDLRGDGSSIIPVGERRFLGLEAGADSAFFLWYVRVAPQPSSHESADPRAGVSSVDRRSGVA